MENNPQRIFQWNIFWADLDPAKGSEQAGKRPVLVVSEEVINQVLPTATILPLTSYKKNRNIYPTEYLLERNDSGLPFTSVILGHQIRTISRTRLLEKCGEIYSTECKEKIRQIIRIYLSL